MFVALGDLHNAVEIGITIAARAQNGESLPVVQVGDLAWHPRRPLPTPPWPIYFVDGNHDHVPSLLAHEEPTEVAPNWIYCPRGTVLQLGGLRVGFLGGGTSIYVAARTRGVDWWPEEEVSPSHARRLLGRRIDVLVTHTPPASVVQKVLGVPEPDYSSVVVEEIWNDLGRPRLVCGHLHQSAEIDGVTVLGELEARRVG